jgi:hypothetical protein
MNLFEAFTLAVGLVCKVKKNTFDMFCSLLKLLEHPDVITVHKES